MQPGPAGLESSRARAQARAANHAVRYLEMPVWLVTVFVFGTVAVIIMIAHLLSALVGFVASSP
jgi:hypothetical protein